MCLLDVALTFATVRNSSRENRMSFGIAQSRFTWQAWHGVTFTRVAGSGSIIVLRARGNIVRNPW